MENTCNDLLARCLRGEKWPSALLERAIDVDEGRAFLSIVVEGLADRFEPRLAETYRQLLTQVVERAALELLPRLRRPGKSPAPPAAKRVYVLSRVTLGADVAVTSVLLDAAKRRYPEAEIFFVGPRKSYEMFETDLRLTHLETQYARGGSLAERLRSSAALWFDDGIVLDPDSRLTQLGLISICPESRYFFFPSREMEASGRLPDLVAAWAREVLGVEARPYVALRPASGAPAEITVSLGVGANEAKRLGDRFERDLLEMLEGRSVLVDKGGSEEERARVERALPPRMRTHDGSFAAFAAEIARSRLFIGYDSAGGHVASAAGVPAISIFAGAVNDRFIERWRPLGEVIRAEDASCLARVEQALGRLTRS